MGEVDWSIEKCPDCQTAKLVCSRAVSDEFVALAAVECDLGTPDVTKVLDDAIARYEAMPLPELPPVAVTPTPAPPISDELIDTARSTAIHDAMQSGMSRAEAEDHFGKPSPAPDVPGLVERLTQYADGWSFGDRYFPMGYEFGLIKEAADALEALQAEVARLTLVKTEMHAAAMDATARATAAEAERDALRAEVERKDKALAQAEACMSIVAPRRDTAKYLRVLEDIRAALPPAKAGG